MSANPPASPPPPAAPPRDTRLRIRGVVLVVFILAEILIGNELALAGSPYPLILLVAHIIVAIGLVLGTAAALIVALRLPHCSVQAVAAVTLLFALGATISGTIFLVAGEGDPALVGMEVLGVLALVGALLLIVYGSVPARPGPASAPAG